MQTYSVCFYRSCCYN